MNKPELLIVISVKFDRGKVEVYPEGTQKPQEGSGLNKECEVTLCYVYLHDLADNIPDLLDNIPNACLYQTQLVSALSRKVRSSDKRKSCRKCKRVFVMSLRLL